MVARYVRYLVACHVCMHAILYYSIPDCVLPPLEVALRQSPSSFSVLCYPCQYRFLLPLIIQVMCPAHFHFVLVTYWTMSVTLVLCLMMMLRLLSFSLILSIFLSVARWLVSSFFTNAFVRDHVWHPYVVAGKTHWSKTFLFRLMVRCMSRKI